MVLTAKVCTSERIGDQKETVSRECFQDVPMLKGRGNSFDCDKSFVSLSVNGWLLPTLLATAIKN